MVKNTHVINGQPIKLNKNEMETFVCCDCGLVHKIFVDKSCTFTAYRDDWATKELNKKSS